MVVAIIVTLTSICRFGFFLDSKRNRKNKSKLTKILRGEFPSGASNLAKVFVNYFDRFFDPDGTGRPNFRRSCVASCIIFGLASPVFLSPFVLDMFEIDKDILAPRSPIETTEPSLENDELPNADNPFIALVRAIETLHRIILILFFILAAYTTNFIGDFFSLCETRIVIRVMETARKKTYFAILLILDLFVTVSIFSIGLLAGHFFLLVSMNTGMALADDSEDIYSRLFNAAVLGECVEMLGDSVEFTKYILHSMFLEGGIFSPWDELINGMIGAILFTSLFTSVWLWVFMVGVIVWPVFSWLSEWFDIDEHPMGTVITCGITILTMVGGFLVLLLWLLDWVTRIIHGTC